MPIGGSAHCEEKVSSHIFSQHVFVEHSQFFNHWLLLSRFTAIKATWPTAQEERRKGTFASLMMCSTVCRIYVILIPNMTVQMKLNEKQIAGEPYICVNIFLIYKTMKLQIYISQINYLNDNVMSHLLNYLNSKRQVRLSFCPKQPLNYSNNNNNNKITSIRFFHVTMK